MTHNCQVGLADRQSAWPQKKKEWYCEHKIGCGPRYDCQAFLANWKSAWSEPKKSWCCAHEELGCPTAELEPVGTPPLEARTSSSGPGLYAMVAVSFGAPAIAYFIYCRSQKDVRRFSMGTMSVSAATQYGRPSSTYTPMRRDGNTGLLPP